MSRERQRPIQKQVVRSGDRQQFILDRLEERGACSYDELAESLRVTTMTIRRDLELLIRKGVVIKTVGGVQRANAPSFFYETELYSRLSVHRAEKRAIAERALDLIGPRATIFVDGSTTCLELARSIAKRMKGLTIVTNSALVCLELGKSTDNTIVGIGGQYDANSLSFVGPQAEDSVKTLFLDLAFVGTKGLLPDKGTFESSLPTFRIKQLVAPRSSRLVLLADHSKFGQRALSKVLEISQIHTVVTDDKTSRAHLAALAEAGPKVCVASRLNVRAERTAHVT